MHTSVVFVWKCTFCIQFRVPWNSLVSTVSCLCDGWMNSLASAAHSTLVWSNIFQQMWYIIESGEHSPVFQQLYACSVAINTIYHRAAPWQHYTICLAAGVCVIFGWLFFFIVSCWYLTKFRRLYLDLRILLNFWLNFLLLWTCSSTSIFSASQKYNNFRSLRICCCCYRYSDCLSQQCTHIGSHIFDFIECEWDGE